MNEKEMVAAQHALIGNVTREPESGYQRTNHPDAQWYPRSLGLFVHWGLPSTKGVGDLSWSMMLTRPGARAGTLAQYGFPAVQAQRSPTDYWKEAEFFKPDQFNPRKWLAAAKRAGFEYAVFTTKHHDGFTLWPSKASTFGVQDYLPGKDLVREFIEACRENDLKVGLYYSPPDWYLERERMTFGETVDANGKSVQVGVDHHPIDASKLPSADAPEFKLAWNAQVKGHLHELLTSYGKIDLLFFDGSSKDAVTLEELRKLQPGILFNNRGLGYGDYDTPECAFPKERPAGWWEYIHIWNDGAWGYLSHEIYKPVGWMISEWIKARTWGGNFLINVGPNGRGDLPTVAYQRFDELVAWRKQYEFSVAKNLEPGLWPERCNAPTLVNGLKWYVHLGFDWDESEVLVRGSKKPDSVRFLTNGKSIDLSWKYEGGDLLIPIRKSLRGVISDIVEIAFPEAK